MRKLFFQTLKNEGKWHFAILFMLVLAFGSNSRNGQLLNYDDERYIQGNPYIQTLDFETLKDQFTHYFDGHYHPLTLLSLSVDRLVFSDAVFGHHLVNWFFHVLNTFLVYFLVIALFKNSQTAWFVSLVFALHPIQVESYAWMSERKNVLYAFFFLLSMWSYVNYVRKEAGFWPVLIFTLLSLLSKAQAVVLLPVFLLIDYVEERDFRNKVLWLQKLPFLIVFGLFLWVTTGAQTESWGNLNTLDYSRFQRFFLASYGFLSYIVKTILPFGISPYYPYPKDIGLSLSLWHYASPLFVMGFLALCYWLHLKKMNQALFGMLFFFFNLVLMLKFFDVPYGNYLWANRYIYLAIIGLTLALSQLVQLKLPAVWKEKRNFHIFTGALAVGMGILSLQQVEFWNKSSNLWGRVSSLYPKYAHAQNMYALGLLAEGETKEARSAFESLLKLDPEFSSAYVNLAVLDFKLGNPEKAKSQILKALQSQPEDPMVLNTAVGIFLQTNQFSEAKPLLEKLLLLQPEVEEHRVQFARTLIMLEDSIQAKKAINQVTDSNKKNALLQLLQQNAKGQNPQVSSWLEQATALGKQGRFAESEALFNKVIEADPNNAMAYINRGTNYALQKEFEKALRDFEKGISLNPSDARPYLMMGYLLRDLGRNAEACAQFRFAKSKGVQVEEGLLRACE